MINRASLATIFSTWRQKGRVSVQQESQMSDSLKRALDYYKNWKSFKLASQSGVDAKVKCSVFCLWRGVIKERCLTFKLHSLKSLSTSSSNTRLSILLLNAFDEWKELLDYRQRKRKEGVKIKDKTLAQWKSLHLRFKARSKTADLICLLSTFRSRFEEWKRMHSKTQKIDHLGSIAWYQRFVGDSFIAWRKLASSKTFSRQSFKTWRVRCLNVKRREDVAAKYLTDKLKARMFNKWKHDNCHLAKLKLKSKDSLEQALRQQQHQLFSSWKGLSDERARQSKLAASLYANQLKVKVLRSWNQSFIFQKVADEHLRGNLLVKGLFWWRAAVQQRTQRRECKDRHLHLWMRNCKCRRLTRFFFGQIMLKSISKYQPSSKALSVLLPSPELPATVQLSRSKFDESRNNARCFYLWLHKTRKSQTFRQLGIEYRKARFSKWLHKWRSQELLCNAIRNEPYNLRKQFFKRWMMRSRMSSVALTKAERKAKVHFGGVSD